MKRLIYTALLFSFISCKKDFLEIVPMGSQVAVTTEDYSKLMNDPAFYLYSYQGGWGEAQLMGDDVAAEATLFSTAGAARPRLFQWRDTIYNISDGMPATVNLLLTQLYAFNKIIREVMDSEGGTDAQKKAIRAEALASRAWTYFQFINFYGKPYVAATAANDPGFPIITEPDVAAKNFSRASVQAVYDFIIRDLTEAIASLPVKPVIQTRMSKGAAEGLLGKVYLYMGKFNDALPMLTNALTDVNAAGLTTLYDYNVTFGTGGAFLPINNITGPKSPGQDQNDIQEAIVSKVFNSGRYSGYGTGNDGLVLTPQAAALYGPTDLRLNFYTNLNPNSSPNPGGRLRKYGVTYSRWGLQLSDLYLLSAEVKARTGDLGGAKTDVEILRKKRMPVADATVPTLTANDQTALVKFIIDERTREFAMEGYRWFDMRRLSVDPLYAGITFTHTMYNADGSTTVYTLNQPNRLVLKMPPPIITAHPEMPDNP